MVGLKRPFSSALTATLGVTLFLTLGRAKDALPVQGAAAPLEITVTADRVDEPVNSTGSDVTVIPAPASSSGSRTASPGFYGKSSAPPSPKNGGPSTMPSDKGAANTQAFATGRVTAAYHIDETGTNLRAAFGDGAKAPTLFQPFSIYVRAENLTDTKYELTGNYGTPGLSIYAGLTAKF